MPAIPEQRLRPQEEIGTKIGTAPLTVRQPVHEILTIGIADISRNLLAAHKRRISHEAIKSASLNQDLGELQRPMERLLAIQPHRSTVLKLLQAAVVEIN